MILLFAYLFLALFVSFMCSIMESVLLSTPQSFLIVQAKEGKAWAQKFSEFKENVDKPLSAILSLNTVAHTIGAAGVGAEAVKVFGEEYLGVVSGVLTILILVITEIIPKTFGTKYWRQLARFSYYTMRIMVVITYPLVLMSALITRMLSSGEGEKTTSREEIAALASIGTDEGIFSEKEDKIIQNLLKLKNIKLNDIMTPRVVVALAEENLSCQEFLENEALDPYSRIPIYADQDENITGYILRKEAASQEDKTKLKDIRREIIVAPEGTKALSLLDRLVENKEHIAIVVDEYGGLEGVVTLEDLIESLLGFEIVDETDEVEDLQKFARDQYESKKGNESES